MALPKKVIARTSIGINQYQICLFRRESKKWHIQKILQEIAPSSWIETKEQMQKFSDELGVPWQKKSLQDSTRKQLQNAQKNERKRAIKAALKAQQLPILTFDGSAKLPRGASAAVIEMPDGTRYIVTKFLASAKSDEAEYTGLIIGLEKALELQITQLTIQGDSEMVINQILGKYLVKPEATYFSYYNRVKELLPSLDFYSLTWIPRRKNVLADRAAFKCLKQNLPEEKSNDYAEQWIEEYIRMYSNIEEE